MHHKEFLVVICFKNGASSLKVLYIRWFYAQIIKILNVLSALLFWIVAKFVETYHYFSLTSFTRWSKKQQKLSHILFLGSCFMLRNKEATYNQQQTILFKFEQFWFCATLVMIPIDSSFWQICYKITYTPINF